MRSEQPKNTFFAVQYKGLFSINFSLNIQGHLSLIYCYKNIKQSFGSIRFKLSIIVYILNMFICFLVTLPASDHTIIAIYTYKIRETKT